MSIRYLDFSGAVNFWTNIKNYILSKIPTKTSELTNDSGFLTQHQSLSNYVTLNGTQTIAGTKTFSSTISGSISGNAGTATQFSANTTVALTGDATGTSAGSKKGWSVPVTLANSGVTAGTYGPSVDVTGSNNATILVPEITVDAKGRVTSVTNRTYTSVNTDSDKKVYQYYKSDDNVYRLLFSNNAGNTATSNVGAVYSGLNNSFYVNPSTGALYATKLYSGGTEVLTSHQSLDNYVTLNSNQTITAIKTITGGNQGKMIFKNPNFTVGTTPESATTVTRIYFGGGASYDGSTGAISNDIASNGNSQLEICALNNNSSNSYRTSLILRYEQDQTRPRFIKSWGDFCPYSNDTYYLGRSDSVWKECYCNAYYLGTTAFGDIVTHNASEFLTSHQSLSSCVKNVVTSNQTIKSTGITRGTAPSSAQTFGIAFSDKNNKYIGNIYGTFATNKATFVGLYAYKGTTTENGDNASVRVGYDASGNVYTSAPTPATTDNSTQIATTAFVKAQGYLTSHQSLANYLTKTTNVSEMGRYIDLHYDNATSKYDYDVRLYVDSQGTAAGGGSFKIAAASAYAPAPASNANDTRIATTAWVNSKGYLTSHPSITLSSNTTSTASPAHGGTFTCIDSVTQDTNGHITKVNTKTVTLPSDSNTDTKVTQTVTTANSTYPVLLCVTANATETGTTTSRFSAGLTVNARYSTISMTNKYDTANTKGVRDSTKGYLNGDIIFRCYDASEMGRIHCESSKNGYQQTYMMASNYIKNGAISPEGTATTCYITVRVRDNGSRTIYTDGLWENSLIPYADNKHSLGTTSSRWKNAYINNLILNGNTFDPASTSGNIGDVVFAGAYYKAITGTSELGLTVPGNSLYLAGFDGNTLLWDNPVAFSGTWKLLGPGKPTTTEGNSNTKRTGLWKRIA